MVPVLAVRGVDQCPGIHSNGIGLLGDVRVLQGHEGPAERRTARRGGLSARHCPLAQFQVSWLFESSGEGSRVAVLQMADG